MNTLITLIIIFISTVLWLTYLNHLDIYRKDKQTTKMVFVCFAAGVASVLFTFLVYELNPFTLLAYRMGPFLYHFLIVGLSEEFAKYAALICTMIVFRSIREPQDGIIQGAAVGAGFGTLENVFYGLRYGPLNAVMRSFVSLGGHMLYTALAGFFFAVAVYSNLEVEDRRSIVIALLAFIPIAMIHGVFNASLTWQQYNQNLAGLFLLVDLFALALTVAAFRSLVEKSPYYIYPYSRTGEAIASILRGLKLNPGSFILNKRLALYYLAAENYPEALKRIRYCRKRMKRTPAVWEVLEGIARIGMGRNEQGIQLLRQAKERFKKGEQFRIELFVYRIIRHGGLRLRVENILRPKITEKNPYFERLLKYGKKDYWKSDRRILAERTEEFRRVMEKEKER